MHRLSRGMAAFTRRPMAGVWWLVPWMDSATRRSPQWVHDLRAHLWITPEGRTVLRDELSYMRRTTWTHGSGNHPG